MKTDTFWGPYVPRALAALLLVGAARVMGGCNLGYETLADLANTGETTGTCSTPSTVSVRRVEVGVGDGFGIPPGGSIRDLQDNDVLPIVTGTQGADMAVLVFRVTGVTGPTCVAQRTTITNAAGERVALLVRPVQLTAVEPDVGQSGPLYLPGEFVSAPLTLTVTLGGQTYTRRLRLRDSAP